MFQSEIQDIVFVGNFHSKWFFTTNVSQSLLHVSYKQAVDFKMSPLSRCWHNSWIRLYLHKFIDPEQ